MGKAQMVLLLNKNPFPDSVFFISNHLPCLSLALRLFLSCTSVIHYKVKNRQVGLTSVCPPPCLPLIEALRLELILDPALIKPRPRCRFAQGHSDLASNHKILWWWSYRLG